VRGTGTPHARHNASAFSSPNNADANATVGQVLSHNTSGSAGNLTFTYSTLRLDALKFVVETCKATTYPPGSQET